MRSASWFCFVMCALLAIPVQGQELPSSLPREDFMVPDGPVRAVLETNGVVYIGGHFDYVGPVLQTGTAMDAVSGTPMPDFPKFAGAIKAILRDANGGWFVGGRFSTAGGFPVLNLAHIRADMTVDADWHPNPDGPVLALAADDERLFVGGSFGTIAGEAHSQLAALDLITGAALAWSADCTNFAPGASVNALAVADGRVYVGGYFRHINGEDRLHVGSVDAATGVVNPWQPNAYAGTEAFTRVDAVAISGQTLFVGGTFLTMGGISNATGVARKYLVALDVTKNLLDAVLPWNPDADAPVTALSLSCDTVFVGGAFTQIAGQPRQHLAAVDALTGRATSWNPEANDDVLSLQLSGNVLFVGGRFTQIGGQPRAFLAALDVSSGEATLWTSQADFGVAGLAVGGGTVVAGGILDSSRGRGQLRKNLAAFDARTGRILDWNPQATGSTVINGLPTEGVFALGASSNVIYVAGAFTEVNGTARNRVAAVDVLTGAVAGWNPDANNIVETLLVTTDAVYVAGPFTAIGGAERKSLAAIDAVSSAVTSWDPNPDQKVTALAFRNLTPDTGLLYAGGRFIEIGGQIRKRLAALDPDSGIPSAWNPNVNDQVSALALMAGQLYLGGPFSTVSGEARHGLAALDLAGGAPICWNPEPRQLLDGVERAFTVNVLMPGNGIIHVGGKFNQLAGVARRNLAALTTNCPATATPWDPSVDGPVNALAISQSQVFAGGTFQFIGGQYRPFFAVFPPEGAPRITRQPRSQLVNLGSNVVLEAEAVGIEPLVYQWQHDGTNVPGATGASLMLGSVPVEQTGDYSLVVTNALGLVNSRSARITVVQPVVIDVQPVSHTVDPGANVTFSVVASGNPPPVYQWRLNGVNIPGAVRPTLTITNAQPADGGSYSVVVASVGSAVNSEIATLLVTSPALGFTNNLAERLMVGGASGLGSGGNVGATRETGETNHVGKLGGRSVWLGWIAPATGIATFNTRGSSFDTLLAIYTNTSAGSLISLAADEDSGGFLTSQASFNAVAGNEYLIVVDGFGGASGNIVLRWGLDTSTVPFPRILTQPISMTVNPGTTNAMFSVTVDNPTSVTYQWFHGCRAIEGATNDTLTIAAVQVADVGRFHVEVRNASTQTARSFDASLDIGPDPKVISYDKLEDLLGEIAAGAGAPPLRAATASSGGFVSVTAGSIDSHTTDNTGSGAQLLEPNHCAVLGGASQWLGLEAASDGMLIIDTVGSAIDTVLAVYYATNWAYLSSRLVMCDNNGAPDGIRSLVRFRAFRATKYVVVVDGVNHAEGDISINWKLGVPPPPGPPLPSLLTVLPGADIMLVAIATNAIPPPTFQWFLNGKPIVGGTQQALTLRNVQSQHAGTYSVTLSNFVDVVMQTNAVVTLTGPLRLLSQGIDSNGHYRLSVDGGTGPGFILQTASNFNGPAGTKWTSLLTNPITQQPFLFLDTNAPRFRQRFYRAVATP